MLRISLIVSVQDADEVAHKFNVENIYKIIPLCCHWRLRSSSRETSNNIHPVPDLNALSLYSFPTGSNWIRS